MLTCPSFLHCGFNRGTTDLIPFQGLESILSNSNTLNRKLEESISVGKEFEPIAGLWGQFADLMARAGIPDANVSGADTGSEERGSATTGTGSVVDDALGGSRGAEEPKLPPGVAPGGGTVYGREAQ